MTAHSLDGVGYWVDDVRASLGSRSSSTPHVSTFKARRSGRAFFCAATLHSAHIPHSRQDLAARPEVHRGRFPAVLLDLELDLLTFIERAQPRALDGGDVHEDIPASTCRLNETTFDAPNSFNNTSFTRAVSQTWPSLSRTFANRANSSVVGGGTMRGFRNSSFDPPTLVVLETAFDEAWLTLKSIGNTTVKPDELARSVLRLAMEGERDPLRLHDGALEGLIPATAWREAS